MRYVRSTTIVHRNNAVFSSGNTCGREIQRLDVALSAGGYQNAFYGECFARD
jgi:hypothetical protein